MKKFLCLISVLSLLFSTTIAFAADTPFISGVDYSQKYDEYGAVPSMLNFGYTSKLSPGESLYDAKTKTVKKIKGTTLVDSLSKSTYYIYAKWQYAQGFSDYTINAMLVMTTPSDEYYATYDTWTIDQVKRRVICSWFFDVSDLLQRYLDEHSNAFEKGTYSFSMFYNDMAFRVSKVSIN